MPNLKKTLVVAFAAAATFTGFGAATPAQAAPVVTCGATLKTNATLTKDLSCPKGNGVTLYRGVTLNLGGHKLTGPGTGSGTAVTLSAKGSSVVTNGTIQNWKTGVRLAGDETLMPLPKSYLTTLTLTNAAVSAEYGPIDLVSVTATNSPMSGQYGGSFTISGSKLTKSRIFTFNAEIVLKSSTMVGGSLTSDYGISLASSTMDGTGTTGGPMGCNEAVITITSSTIKNYQQPIGGYYCDQRITNSTFLNNPGGAIFASTEGASGPITEIRGSTFRNSGIAVQQGAVIIDISTFIGNTTGVLVAQDKDSAITNSTFTSNTSSGIRTDIPGLTVGGNKATNNGGYGIYAPAANDLGGNVAYGNKRGQCVGLSCPAR